MLGTIIRRADRRKRLLGNRLPRDVEKPLGAWRPTIRETKRVRFDGYGHYFQLEATGVLGRWRLYKSTPCSQSPTELTTAPVEFDDAFALLHEHAEAVRAMATAAVEQDAAIA